MKPTLNATGEIWSVSSSIFQMTQRKMELLELEKCWTMSCSLDIDDQVLYSSSTVFFNWALFSFGPKMDPEKNVLQKKKIFSILEDVKRVKNKFDQKSTIN